MKSEVKIFDSRQPNQDYRTSIDSQILRLMTGPGVIRGGKAVYVEGTSPLDSGYVKILPEKNLQNQT